MMSRNLCFLTLLTASATISLFSPLSAETPFAPGDFKSALALAGRTKRIVLVDFYTTWCGPCKQLDETTWKNKTVRTWLSKNTISRKIDAEKQTSLADKYKIRAYPTILLLKPDGTEIDRLVGYRQPTAFLTEVKQALAGQGSVARAKAKLNAEGKNNPMERMNYGRALAEKGRSAEALKEFVWCLDKGNQYDPAFSGVRLSFLLGDIKELGAEYPPAMTALTKRRDAARVALKKGSVDRQVAADFAAYNWVLEQQEDTLLVYDNVKKKNPRVATAMFRSVRELLLEQKRYADFIEGSRDIATYVDEEINDYNQMGNEPELDKKTKEYMKEAKKTLKVMTVEKCAGLYEALLGTGQTGVATSVGEKLIKFDPSAATYTSLMKHAIRAGKPEVAEKLREAAKTTLPATELDLLDKTENF